MADLQDILSSGDITGTQFDTTAAGDKVLKSDEVEALITAAVPVAISTLVPYTGATTDVDLGDNTLTTKYNVLGTLTNDGQAIYRKWGTAQNTNVILKPNQTIDYNAAGVIFEFPPLFGGVLVTEEGIASGIPTAKIGDVATGDYLNIDEDGQIRLYGEATQWTDLRVGATATKKGGSKEPTFTKILDNGAASQGVFAEAFSASTEEELYFEVQLPHGWKEGSTIEAHVHWLPLVSEVVTSKVSWGLEYSWSNIGDAFGNTTIIYGDTVSLGSTAVVNSHCLTELGAIVATGKTLSSMLMCRVFRDATGTGGTDDYASLASLLEIDFHYQMDALGSASEYVKY